MTKDICIECTVTATSDERANEIFKIATQRLLSVNTWNKLNGSLLSDCRLMDERGFNVDRNVHTNDYLQIEEYDEQSTALYKWIKFEKVEESQISGDSESIVLQTSSSVNPWTGSENAEHVVRPGIISVVRKGLHITARVYAEAQNEIDGQDVIDTMRNISTAVYSTLGAYCVRWRSLVHAFLSDLREADEVNATAS